MQSQSRLFDDLARVITGAAGAAQGVGDEMRGIVRAQVERLVADMDLVPREEFDVVRDMAVAARSENERLREQVEALEARLAKLDGAAALVTPGTSNEGSPKPARKKTAAKKTAKKGG